MIDPKQSVNRDLFQIDNAKGLSRNALVATFVPTDSYWRLLSSKNHLVLGSRGSGKTALAKMVSHSHLVRFAELNTRAQHIVEDRSHIGIYSPTSIGWVGGLKNKPWFNDEEAELFFQWRLNCSTCMSFVDTLRSCLDTYVPDKGARARLERSIAAEISEIWSEKATVCHTTGELDKYLKDLERQKQSLTAKQRVNRGSGDEEECVGPFFDTELYTPLRAAMEVTTLQLGFPEDTAWLLCLDEAEFLEPVHLRILNSHLRAHSGNLFFNITTLPYEHSNETNTRVPLDSGHDYEIVYIDRDPVMWAGSRGREGVKFAKKLFELRLKASRSKYSDLTLERMLGQSELLDSKPSDWSPGSANMELLRKHANEATISRAERLINRGDRFRDAVTRKLQGALVLREKVKQATGRRKLDVYSGMTMIIRCCDSNPRRMITVFKYLLNELRHQRPSAAGKRSGTFEEPLIPREIQTGCLEERSKRELDKVKAESAVGPDTWRMLRSIGLYCHAKLHDMPLGTDQIYSVCIDNRVTDREWELVKKAVTLGLLYPNVSTDNPDQMPEREGSFHFAYILAPHFQLLPRRGRAHKLSAMFRQIQPEPEQTALEF